MKANYKVVNNRQAQLKKVIQNFEPTGVRVPHVSLLCYATDGRIGSCRWAECTA